MLRVLLPVLIAAFWSGPALSQDDRRVEPLYRALGLPEIVAIMREEGIDYGLELEAELFPGRGGARWAAVVEQIYDLDRMEETVLGRLDTDLASADLAPMTAFFGSDLGREIVQLEVTARRALLDEGVEEVSRAVLEDLTLARDPRLDLIRDFAEANGLVENNVVGAMNSNYAFYTGLADGGAFPGEMTEEQILTDVWSQEEAIREDTEAWLYSYLVMAYRPLSDADIEAYIAFSRTGPGTVLNRAMFDAFDEMFAAVSLALGRAAAGFLAGEEL
ncbi:MAG: DUF2059 domain-containing protein [Rhodobacter sp.]|nr:DUF2059 domain-containing protein [Rhodobacter sp.]